MNNEHVGLRNFVRRLDQGAARLNPGLSAIAVVLVTLVTGEAAVRIVSAWSEELAAQAVPLTVDPTLLTSSGLPPDE